MNKVFAIIIIFLTNALLAIEPIVIVEGRDEYPLGLYLEILEDKEGKLTIDDIRKPEMESRWVKNNVEVPSFGFTKSAYWTRFRIQAKPREKYFLEIAYSSLDQIDFYTLAEEGEMVHKEAGDFLPFKDREIQYRNFVFLLISSGELEKKYYIRFETESSMQFPMTVWSPITFTEKKNNEMMGMGLYFGVMLVMVLYNLFIWFSVRDENYFYYVVYIIFISLYLSNLYGITYQYLWFGSPSWYNTYYPFILFLATLSMIVFTSNFLKIKESIPFFYRMYRLLVAVNVLCFIASSFVSFRIAIMSAAVLVIFIVIWCLTTAIIMLKRRYRPARFYLLAWSVFLIGAMSLALKTAGIFPSNFFTDYSVQFGSALEVILLSLGLADRINILKREKEIAQAESMANQRLAIENLQKSNKIKDEFLSNLSHELKTPLSVVYSYSEMIASGKASLEKVKKYSGKIFESARKLNDYVSDLILISDLESDLQLQKSKVDLQKIISSIVETHRATVETLHTFDPFDKLRGVQLSASATSLRLDEKAIQIELNFVANDDLPIKEINCDSILLEKAISAVLKNAIVYNKPGGRVQISFATSLRGAVLQIKITDTGIGIEKEFHEKVFEKFFRIDSSLTYTVSGVGVGLFIAKKIIELHDGDIQLESELEKGTTVTINLPLPEKDTPI